MAGLLGVAAALQGAASQVAAALRVVSRAQKSRSEVRPLPSGAGAAAGSAVAAALRHMAKGLRQVNLRVGPAVVSGSLLLGEAALPWVFLVPSGWSSLAAAAGPPVVAARSPLASAMVLAATLVALLTAARSGGPGGWGLGLGGGQGGSVCSAQGRDGQWPGGVLEPRGAPPAQMQAKPLSHGTALPTLCLLPLNSVAAASKVHMLETTSTTTTTTTATTATMASNMLASCAACACTAHACLA